MIRGFRRVERTGNPFGDLVCYHAATRTPGTRRIQEDIELCRVAFFAYA
jgi:hypothetical protein